MTFYILLLIALGQKTNSGEILLSSQNNSSRMSLTLEAISAQMTKHDLEQLRRKG